MEIVLRYLNLPKDYKYRRRIWLGTRSVPPELDDTVKIGREMTIKDEVIDIKLYPVLLIWETNNGEKKYAEITKTFK